MPRPSKEVLQARIAKARAKRLENLEARRTPMENLTKVMDGQPLEALPDPLESLSMSEHRWLGEPRKSMYIPSWYRAHKYNYAVKQNGVTLGFRVAEVLPERRWPIEPDGELMKQNEFETRYEQYMSAMQLGKVEPRLQHIPRVERYVNAMPDPRGGPGYVAIGFDPNRAPEVEDDGMRYDPIHDAIFSIQEKIERESFIDRKANLADMLARGDISAATFEREMRDLAPKIEFQTETPSEPEASPPSA